MIKLPALESLPIQRGTKVFVRVDWNIPLSGHLGVDQTEKIRRSLPTIRWLKSRGAVVILATHLGRPEAWDRDWSTKRLMGILSREFHLDVGFLPFNLSKQTEENQARRIVELAHPGSVFLLENVRFFAGEEENAPPLIKSYASLAHCFVNEAFASSHRAHASVVGIAKKMPHATGLGLMEEIRGLEPILEKPKHPFVAVVGGAKISTKINVLKMLLQEADTVCVGGAMATVLLRAQGYAIGNSFVEEGVDKIAKGLIKEPNLLLPVDVLVTDDPTSVGTPHAVEISQVGRGERIVDIGPKTMQAWAAKIQKAKTILWNGPVGMAEIPAFAHGSRVLAQVIASRCKGRAYGVVGGGDTVPILLSSQMSDGVDHISMGGGALLEYLETHGKLPGIQVLEVQATAKRVRVVEKKIKETPKIQKAALPKKKVVIAKKKTRSKKV